jgi:superfamily II DNA or RNA helicase
MKSHDRLLVVHGTGSGKTLTAAHVAKDFFIKNPERNIVIFVTPAAVQSQFQKSVSTVLSQRPGIYFTTYTGLTTFLKDLHANRRETFKKIVKHAMIIADEAHYLTEDSQKASIFYNIFSHAEKVVLMTGTPIMNGQPADLLPYAKILNPNTTITAQDMNHNFARFFKCKVSLYEVPQTSSNFPTMLPTERHTFNLNNTQLNQVTNSKMQKAEFRRWTGAGVGTNRTKPLKPGGWSQNRQLYTSKIFPSVNADPKHQKFLDIFRQRPYKTIVYFQEYKTLDAFAKFLERRRIRYRRVTGKEANKGEIIKRDAPAAKMVYLLTAASKEGLDFKGVRSVIFMDYPWVPSNYNQIVGRARRYKSHINLPLTNRNVKVFELAYSHPSKKTLNMRSINIINNKKSRTAAMFQRLISVSIETTQCPAPRIQPASEVASPNNRTLLRPNRRYVPGTNYAVDPSTGAKYHEAALNIPRNQKLKPPKPINIGSMLKERKPRSTLKLRTRRQKTKPARFSPKRGGYGTGSLFSSP